jgi:hypothetical protein
MADVKKMSEAEFLKLQAAWIAENPSKRREVKANLADMFTVSKSEKDGKIIAGKCYLDGGQFSRGVSVPIEGLRDIMCGAHLPTVLAFLNLSAAEYIDAVKDALEA